MGFFFFSHSTQSRQFITTKPNRSPTVNVTLQLRAARPRSQGNRNNYFSTLLSFVNSSCTHSSSGLGLLAHPQLFVLKPFQQRGSSWVGQGFMFQPSGRSHPTSCNTPFPVFQFPACRREKKRLLPADKQFKIHCLVHPCGGKLQPSSCGFSCAQ